MSATAKQLTRPTIEREGVLDAVLDATRAPQPAGPLDNVLAAATPPWPIVSDDPDVQADYEARRCEGQGHLLAEMLALGRPPGTKGTNKAFMQGRHSGNQFAHCPEVGKYLQRIARKHGGNGEGHYISGLGNFLGDPRAFVKSLDDAKGVSRERNYTVDGAFTRREVRGIHDTNKPSYGPAPDIIAAEVAKVVEANPDARHELPQVRRQVTEQLKGYGNFYAKGASDGSDTND